MAVCDKCNDEEFVDDLITFYFNNGYTYDAIVGLLKHSNACEDTKKATSIARLRKKGNLVRVNEHVVGNKIMEEMNSPGKLAGYRSIWHALRIRHGIHVPRTLVTSVMKEIDLEGKLVVIISFQISIATIME